ncbi:MAG: amidohydrolase, partial [Acidobacteriaceae bacterium]|nr:amidohydrolase [Acidobacteriaceae bacterium]
MRKLQPSSAVLLSLLLAACLRAQPTPTLLLVNGKIWTVNPGLPEVEAVAITNDRIVAVGSSEEISSWKRPGIPVIDLEGR